VSASTTTVQFRPGHAGRRQAHTGQGSVLRQIARQGSDHNLDAILPSSSSARTILELCALECLIVTEWSKFFRFGSDSAYFGLIKPCVSITVA